MLCHDQDLLTRSNVRGELRESWLDVVLAAVGRDELGPGRVVVVGGEQESGEEGVARNPESGEELGRAQLARLVLPPQMSEVEFPYRASWRLKAGRPGGPG